MIREQQDHNCSMLTPAAREIGLEKCRYQVICKGPERADIISGVTPLCSGSWTVVFDPDPYDQIPTAYLYFELFKDALAVDMAFN